VVLTAVACHILVFGPSGVPDALGKASPHFHAFPPFFPQLASFFICFALAILWCTVSLIRRGWTQWSVFLRSDRRRGAPRRWLGRHPGPVGLRNHSGITTNPEEEPAGLGSRRALAFHPPHSLPTHRGVHSNNPQSHHHRGIRTVAAHGLFHGAAVEQRGVGDGRPRDPQPHRPLPGAHGPTRASLPMPPLRKVVFPGKLSGGGSASCKGSCPTEVVTSEAVRGPFPTEVLPSAPRR